MSAKGKRDEIVAGIVAGGAFIASAAHIITVAVESGNHPAIAAVHAIGIDGLIYIGIRAMQRGQRLSGGAALIYGAAVSLIFNAASYGAFAMPKIVIAFTMPVALLLAVLVVHGSHTEDTDTEDTATRTHVRLDVHRQSVPVSRPTAPVPTQVVHPAPATVSGEVVRPEPAKAITRKPHARQWDVEQATRMIMTTPLSNHEIAAQVGTSYKTIQRLRTKVTNGEI